MKTPAILLVISLLRLGLCLNYPGNSNLGGSECCELNDLTISEIRTKLKGGAGSRSFGPEFSPQGSNSQSALDFHPGYGWGGWYKSIIYRGGTSYSGFNGGPQGSSQYGQETQVRQFQAGQSGRGSSGQDGSRGYDSGQFGGQESRSEQGGVVCCENSRGGNRQNLGGFRGK